MNEPSAPSRRFAGIAVIAFSSVAWWPAFTLGAWGTVFYHQVMSLWAVATAAFVLSALSSDVRRRVGPWALTLLIPTLWLLLALKFPPGSRQDLAWFGTAITLLGAPALIWLLVRFAAPDLAEDATPRDRAVVVGAVVVVVVGAFLVGRFNDRFLTCGDFSLSGNSQPPGCYPGDPSLDILGR